jgi:hypothetical protein
VRPDQPVSSKCHTDIVAGMAIRRSLHLLAAVVLLSGCGVAAKEVGEIVLKIGTDIVVQAGADYIGKILSPDDAKGHPTLVVSHTDAAGDGVGADYALANASRITTQNVTIKDISGDIHIVGDGNGIAVTVASGATATIAIAAAASAGGVGNAADGADDQAATINGILGWSGRSRRALFGALDDLNECRNVTGATEALQTVANDRSHQIDALDDVDVSALPNGSSLRNTLLKALNYSLKADRAFVRWGDAQQNGCHDNADHDDAMAYSRDATATKQQFLRKWNPVAATYGLPELDEPDI